MIFFLIFSIAVLGGVVDEDLVDDDQEGNVKEAGKRNQAKSFGMFFSLRRRVKIYNTKTSKCIIQNHTKL